MVNTTNNSTDAPHLSAPTKNPYRKTIIILAVIIGLSLSALILFNAFNDKIFDSRISDPSLRKSITILINVVMVFLIGILLAMVAIFFIIENNVRRVFKNVVLPIGIIFAALIMTVFLSMYLEYVPQNYTTLSITNVTDNPGFSGFYTMESSMQVPLRNTIEPKISNITFVIFSKPHNTAIEDIRLSTTSNTIDNILTYSEKFSNFSDSTTPADGERFGINVTAQHNLKIQNSSIPLKIDILYTIKNTNLDNRSQTSNNQLEIFSIPIDWSLRTLDMSLISYFWVVMIGVIVSRILTLALDKLRVSEDFYQAKLGSKDVLWIGFSFIIAILVFQSFNSQVTLTPLILNNLTLAFAFGFGFDKTLEVAKRFNDVVPERKET